MDKIARTELIVYNRVVGLASEEARQVWWHVVNGAHWQCAAPYGCRNRRYFAHQIMYIVKGWGEGEYRGERFRAGPGTAVLMDLSEIHSYHCDPADPWEMMWVRLDGPGVHAAFETLLRAGRSCVLPVADGARMRRDFRALFRQLETQAPGREAWAAARLMALVANVQEGVLHADSGGTGGGGGGGGGDGGGGKIFARAPAGIAAAANYLRSHHLETVALADVARKANMSLYHFLRRFKQVTGFTPMAYLENYRIGRAQELLLERPDLRLKEIAVQVGLPDPAYFSRVFRKRVGSSPRSYRRSLELR